MRDLTVLLVEDNYGDVRLVEGALEDLEFPGTVHTVQTGKDALAWLRRDPGFAESPRPDLVLLDLNLPATDGLTVLEEIKSDPELERTPVVVLTGSQSDSDLVEAYEKRANALLTKPVDPEEFAERVRAFAEFWLSAARLPTVDGPPVEPRD